MGIKYEHAEASASTEWEQQEAAGNVVFGRHRKVVQLMHKRAPRGLLSAKADKLEALMPVSLWSLRCRRMEEVWWLMSI